MIVQKKHAMEFCIEPQRQSNSVGRNQDGLNVVMVK